MFTIFDASHETVRHGHTTLRIDRVKPKRLSFIIDHKRAISPFPRPIQLKIPLDLLTPSGPWANFEELDISPRDSKREAPARSTAKPGHRWCILEFHAWRIPIQIYRELAHRRL